MKTFVRVTDPGNPVVNDTQESGGGSWEDLNGDGLLDLFVAYGNLSNQNDGLYLNLGGTNFLKVVTGPVVTRGGTSIGGCWGDWVFRARSQRSVLLNAMKRPLPIGDDALGRL